MSGYRTQSLDTPEAVERIVFAGYRRMSPSEKLARMVELSLTEINLEIRSRGGVGPRSAELCR